MVVARRDPPLHVDAHDAASPNFNAYAAPKASKLARFLTVMQVTGSLLAVPVGIASAYSFYRANFSPETTCQGLRNNIVALLDKSVDATTRRVLVRRDVETFEKTCGSVDPDATAAFKTLLAVEKAAVPPAVAPSAPKVQRNETAAKDSIHKPEPRPQTPKQAVTPANSAVPEPARRDAAISDTQWLDAVRQALVTHKEDARATETGPPVLDAAKPQTIPAPVVRPASRDVGSASPAAAKSGTVPTAPAMTPIVAPVVAPAPGPSVAPPLPPAIPIAPPPAAAQATENHPVPPESIPESAPPASADTAESGRSRIGKWISAIPLLGPVVDNVRH